jgi:hypothetical protein
MIIAYAAVGDHNGTKIVAIILKYKQQRKLYVRIIQAHDNMDALFQSVSLIIGLLKRPTDINFLCNSEFVANAINGRREGIAHSIFEVIDNYQGKIKANLYSKVDPNVRIVTEEAQLRVRPITVELEDEM